MLSYSFNKNFSLSNSFCLFNFERFSFFLFSVSESLDSDSELELLELELSELDELLDELELELESLFFFFLVFLPGVVVDSDTEGDDEESWVGKREMGRGVEWSH